VSHLAFKKAVHVKKILVVVMGFLFFSFTGQEKAEEEAVGNSGHEAKLGVVKVKGGR
jgi:hypothetical protein